MEGTSRKNNLRNNTDLSWYALYLGKVNKVVFYTTKSTYFWGNGYTYFNIFRPFKSPIF